MIPFALAACGGGDEFDDSSTGTSSGARQAAYATRPNTLNGNPACAGYTDANYQTFYQANANGPDAQLHSLCAGAYNYYAMYLSAIRQGYSEADANRTYAAFQDAATVAIDFYRSNRS